MSRVLVVEDEAHLADGLRFNLQAEGHVVEIVSDGETALERLIEKEEHFDAVVLDVMLPGKSGFDVASVLRERKNYVPIRSIRYWKIFSRLGTPCSEGARPP